MTAEEREAAEAKRKAKNKKKKQAKKDKKKAAEAKAEAAVDVSDANAAAARGSPLGANLSAAAAAASTMVGEDEEGEDETAAAGGAANGKGSAGAAAVVVEEEEMDAKAWLDAAKNGELSDMKRLLQHDPSLLNESSAGIGHTALHWCAARGHVNCLTFLLQSGAAPSDVNESGSTPLHAAAANGQFECARLLFEDEYKIVGSPCPLLAERDIEGRTAYMIAKDRGFTELADLLEKHTSKEGLLPLPEPEVPDDDSDDSDDNSPFAQQSSKRGGGKPTVDDMGGMDLQLLQAMAGAQLGGGGGGGGGMGGLGGLAAMLGGGLGAMPPPPKAANGSSSPARNGSGGESDSLSEFDKSELTCLIDVLSALGDREWDPPLTTEQKSCVAKLGSVLFKARLAK